jgi:hypothetical protein
MSDTHKIESLLQDILAELKNGRVDMEDVIDNLVFIGDRLKGIEASLNPNAAAKKKRKPSRRAGA